MCGCVPPTKTEVGFWRKCSRIFSVLFLLVCTLSGTAVLFWGTSKTGKALTKTSKVVINATDFALDTTDSIAASLYAAADAISDPTAQATVLQAASDVDGGTGAIGKKVSKIKKKIPLILKVLFVFLNLIAALIVFFTVIGFVGICTGSTALGTTAFLGMAFLLVAAWLLAGLDFALSNVTNDVCQTMEDYNNDPTSTSLANIFPCQNQASADSTSGSAKSAIKSIVADTNTAIGTINTNTGSSLPLICDPYGAGPGYADVACGGATKLMANFHSDYGTYKCIDDNQAGCTASSTPMTLTVFNNIAAAMDASATIAALVPNIDDIMTCSFIHNAFADLVSFRCVKLIDGLNISWLGFTMTGAFMMPLQIFWILI